jgi:DNA ligase 1
MKFFQVSQIFKQIEQESSRIAITKLLADLFQKATPHEAKILGYLTLGLLRPSYEGSQFNMAEKSALKVIALVLGKAEQTIKEHAKRVGDVGSVLLEGDWKSERDVTLTNVYDRLVTFSKITGVGSQEEKIKDFAQLIGELDQLSACFVMRIMLGKLRLGFSDMTIIDALSWMLTGDKSLSDEIEHAYNISVDIGKIAETAKAGGIDAIRKMKITVGIPIRPAAAERLPTAADIIKKIGPCVAQPKLDGFRLQVHLDKQSKVPKIWFFSRNLIDMSAMFPDLLEDVKKLDVQDLIVEGEAIAYDEQTDTYLPFQETVKRKRKHDIEEVAAELPLRLVLFDILYRNGSSLMDKPQQDREKLLKSVVQDQALKSIIVIDEKKVETAEELNAYFQENITAGLEGLVVKRPDASYQPGKRNFNWIKLKRHEEEGMLEDTLDLVVLGYYAGKGKRTQFGIGAFLVGVYNHDEDRFETVAKIGTGLSDEGWRDLKKRCDREKVDHQMPNVIVDKSLVPDVWIAPAIVVMIRADEITRSPVHTAGRDKEGVGYALRFPRFMEYRIDKSPTEATTIQELKTMYKHQKKK